MTRPHLNLEPTKGKEQRRERFVFVLSPAEHNRRGLAIRSFTDSGGVALARERDNDIESKAVLPLNQTEFLRRTRDTAE
jgi:mRNA-degrading endonuclease toxin of MazEF toxin-antitoxin module